MTFKYFIIHIGTPHIASQDSYIELFGCPLSPAHWPWPKSVTCPLSPTRFDPILTTVGRTNIKKLPNLGLIVTIYSRWPIAKFRPCCPLSPPWPNNSKWYSSSLTSCCFYWIFRYDRKFACTVGATGLGSSSNQKVSVEHPINVPGSHRFGTHIMDSYYASNSPITKSDKTLPRYI